MSMGTKKATESAASIKAPPPHLFARQPLSAFGKIAFWLSVVEAIAGIGGVVTLFITSGAPSRDSVTGMACALAIALLLATKMRWAPLVTTVLGTYNFYLVATEPYALASLNDPKGSDGGFGKFIGVVIILACAILVAGCSIGAAVQNYRQGSRKAPRWLPAAVTLVAGMAIGAIFIGALSLPPTAGTTYTNGVPTVHLSATNFNESAVTITKGSKLMLVDDTPVVHILANGSWRNGVPMPEREPGAPLVHNVSLSNDSAVIGPFTTVGTYHIYCIIHQGMNLTVIVR
jgi:plastocyanin